MDNVICIPEQELIAELINRLPISAEQAGELRCLICSAELAAFREGLRRGTNAESGGAQPKPESWRENAILKDGG